MARVIKMLSILAAVILFSNFLKVFFHESYIDFRVYIEATTNYINGLNIYEGHDPHMSYLYPPITILIFIPFTFLPIIIAEKIWIILSILLFIYSLNRLFKLLDISWKSQEALLYMVLLLLFFPFKFTIGMGQVNILTFFCLTMFFSLYHKRNMLSSFFLMLAIIIKVSPVLFLFYLIIRKKWEMLYWISIFFLCFGTLSLFMFPLETNHYVFEILPNLSQAWPTSYYNQSITGVVGRLPLDTIWLTWLRLGSISLVLVVSSVRLLLIKNDKHYLLELSSIIPLLLMVSSFSWQHHFVLLLISYIILTHVLLKSYRNTIAQRVMLCGILVSFMLVGYNSKHPEMVPVLLQSHVFWGTMLVWIMHVIALREKT